MEKVRCLIIGGGPAGYTAAVYAARAGLSPVLYEGLEPGGQLMKTTLIENFPGFPEGKDAASLMADMRAQAVKFGADIRRGSIVSVDFSSRPFAVVPESGDGIAAESVIIATGATARYLGLASEQEFIGRGVSACATCDGFFYRGRDVAVIGGGDTACSEALYLAGLCRKVYLIIRRNELRASGIIRDRVMETPNIEILRECNVSEVVGNDLGVESLRILGRDGRIFEVKVDGMFLAIGHKPASGLFAAWLETDSEGFIKTREGSQMTSVEGVFAAGDVQDPVYMQAVTAAASGCRAALDVEKFLKR